MKLTQLSFILIALAVYEPRSGYALRRAFVETPLGRYSSSPGSIYPALRKLTDGGFLSKEDDLSAPYEPTKAGLDALEEWLALPIEREDVERDLDTLLLRYSLLGLARDSKLTVRFLKQFLSEVTAHLASLKAFAASEQGRAMPFHSRSALNAGTRTYEAKAQWAEHALREAEALFP
ncbi:MAG: PadR family transcriptional regulator [Pseudomonadota bacterium]